MKINLLPKQEFTVIPKITENEGKPFKITFREPLAGDYNPYVTYTNDFYNQLLINCFVSFENKIEMELDGKSYIYNNYRQFIEAGSSQIIYSIHQECMSKMVDVFIEQQMKKETLEKKSKSVGKSTNQES